MPLAKTLLSSAASCPILVRNILRSWQASVLDPHNNTLSFPTVGEVESTDQTTTPNLIKYMHHHLQWSSSFYIKEYNIFNVLIVHLANDGFLYIPDSESQAVQWDKPNVCHPNNPTGWAVIAMQLFQSLELHCHWPTPSPFQLKTSQDQVLVMEPSSTSLMLPKKKLMTNSTQESCGEEMSED